MGDELRRKTRLAAGGDHQILHPPLQRDVQRSEGFIEEQKTGPAAS
ncbi:MAG TPA: hypothetical protein GX700_06935, partial [Paracoccus sp.]|nr:hypothetical protein [Paracoccus sp. (in: a-proteobacteria)]